MVASGRSGAHIWRKLAVTNHCGAHSWQKLAVTNWRSAFTGWSGAHIRQRFAVTDWSGAHTCWFLPWCVMAGTGGAHGCGIFIRVYPYITYIKIAEVIMPEFSRPHAYNYVEPITFIASAITFHRQLISIDCCYDLTKFLALFWCLRFENRESYSTSYSNLIKGQGELIIQIQYLFHRYLHDVGLDSNLYKKN